MKATCIRLSQYGPVGLRVSSVMNNEIKTPSPYAISTRTPITKRDMRKLIQYLHLERNGKKNDEIGRRVARQKDG